MGELFLLIVLLATLQQPSTITEQSTSGWCSPAIDNVVGDVTVNCKGVDPRALKRLNALLSQKNQELSEKIREANEWAERYHELEKRLAEAGNDVGLSHQAEESLHEGDLETAGSILDRILKNEEKQVDRIAANHYNRALVFELQFRTVDALPHLEQAYQYRPSNFKYALEYANALLKEGQFAESRKVTDQGLKKLRQLAEDNPSVYLPNLAGFLNNLGILQIRTQELKKAQETYEEAISINRRLAEGNPAYLPALALNLINLGILCEKIQRRRDAEAAYQEALSIYRRLADTNRGAALPGEARVLSNLGVLYQGVQRLKEAQDALKEAIGLYRQLAKDNSALPGLALALDSLGDLCAHTEKPEDAEA